MKNFWADLPQPFFVLAPLANVTDAAFRRIIAKYSKTDGATPYVTYTEFVSADGLCKAGQEGRAKLMRDLVFSNAERPIVAQFFTSTPEHMEKAAALAQELGFDGVDINMGCPDKTIEKQGAGAKLMLNSALAVQLIEAAKRGAPLLPVSVKTRLGYNKDILDEWLPALLAAKPAAITIHARTRKEMSGVPARWERVKRAVGIRNELKSETLIIGNGDVKDLEDAEQKIKETGADGAMLGRAVFGNPWLFSPCQGGVPGGRGGQEYRPLRSSDHLPLAGEEIRKKLKVMLEHTKLFERLLGNHKNFAVMKKHFKAYVNGFDGAKELRVELMETKNAKEVEKIIGRFLKNH